MIKRINDIENRSLSQGREGESKIEKPDCVPCSDKAVPFLTCILRESCMLQGLEVHGTRLRTSPGDAIKWRVHRCFPQQIEERGHRKQLGPHFLCKGKIPCLTLQEPTVVRVQVAGSYFFPSVFSAVQKGTMTC